MRVACRPPYVGNEGSPHSRPLGFTTEARKAQRKSDGGIADIPAHAGWRPAVLLSSPCSLCLRGEFCLAVSRPLAHGLTVLLVNFARRRFSSSLAAKAWFHACVTCATGEPGK